MASTQNSYRQIAKSTGIFGGSQVLNMLIGVLRTKVVALLLGPVGVGVMSLYQSIIDMIRSVTDLGLSFSSVKDMAEAHASGDEERISKTATVLHRWVQITAILGTLLTILFSKQISLLVFGGTDKIFPICLLSFCIYMSTISAGQRALLQGTRRIGDMAKASVFGTFIGFVFSSILFYFLGEKGIVPSLLLIALISLICSWWYAHRVRVKKVYLSVRETMQRGKSMLVLGCYSMVVGLVSTLSMLLIKTFIRRWAGEDVVGLFQSSWSITAMSLSAIFSAMAADYYPRLCSIQNDNIKMTQYVNEQLRVALLLSTGIVVGMLLFSPWILQVFYSSKFVPAESLLRWLMLGSFLKVVNWPFAYVILSKNKGWLFLLTELLWHILFFSLTLLLWQYVELESPGVAYMAAHILYTLVIWLIVRKLCDFRLERKNILLLVVFSLFVAGAFYVACKLPIFNGQKCLLSLALLLAVFAVSIWEWNKIYPWKELISKIKKRIRPS